MAVKTVAVLTSGGDAPGMNACIATVAQCVEQQGAESRGIFGGFRGLLDGRSIPIGTELSGLARRGGTFLGSCGTAGIGEELAGRSIPALLNSVDALVVIGGGGSLGLAAQLSAAGVPVVGVPCTIDNDVPGTDYCLGFDSAVNKAVRAADELMDTAESIPERVFMPETMGGGTGHLAISAAYAVQADAVFVHELTPAVDRAAAKIKAKMDVGGTHGLVVLCEGLDTVEIANRLEAQTGRRVRPTVLGHVQRGGSPTWLDRTLARAFGEAAVSMIFSGETGKVVAIRGGDVVSIPLVDIAAKPREIDRRKYDAVNG